MVIKFLAGIASVPFIIGSSTALLYIDNPNIYLLSVQYCYMGSIIIFPVLPILCFKRYFDLLPAVIVITLPIASGFLLGRIVTENIYLAIKYIL